MRFTLSVLFVCLLFFGCEKDEGNGNGNGEEEGCQIEVVPVSFQTEIDAASDGDTVLVQPGTYTGSINFNGKNIVVGSLYLTTGDTSFINRTVIDANQKGSVVRFENNETSGAALVGLTLTGGSAYEGGGIYIDGASPTLRQVVVTGNKVETCVEGKTTIAAAGGGIYMNYSQAIFDTVFVTDNKSEGAGGGIFMQSSDPSFWCVSVHNDTADSDGGGIYMKASSPEMVRMGFEGNRADRGGAIFLSLSSPKLENVYITGGGAESEGGGMYLINSGPTLVNVTIGSGIESGHCVFPTTAVRGGGMYLTGSSASIMNSQLYYCEPEAIYFQSTGSESSVTISYSDVEGLLDGIADNDNGLVTMGEGNIDVVPIFGSGCGCDNWEGDITCAMEGPGGIPIEGSPGWDAGNVSSQYNDVNGTRNNMGAYGGPNGCCNGG